MKIKQIGNGGAFDYKSVNSSFLIENKGKVLLFDCGHSVYAELRRLDEDFNINFDLKDLNSVYISHMDDDHIGSLKTLIYHQYFMNSIKLDIIVHESLRSQISEFLDDIDGYIDNSKKIEAELFTIKTIESEKTFNINSLALSPTDTHHFKPCYGLLAVVQTNTPEKYRHAVLITGDTIATRYIRAVIQSMDNMFREWKVFHDFSYWNSPSQQVHCCKSNFDEVYDGFQLKDKIEFYHNNDKFDNTWQKV